MSNGIGRFACLLAGLPLLAFAQEPSSSSDTTSQPPPEPAQESQPPANPQAMPQQNQQEESPPQPPPESCPTAPQQAPPPAVPPPPPPPPKWNGYFSLGYVMTSGNANSSTFNLKFDLDYKSDPWENVFNGSGFRNHAAGVTTDEKYSIGDKLLFNLGPEDYTFAQLAYDHDRFGAIAERLSGAAGYGRHVLHSATQTLDLDFGVGGDHTREQGAGHFRSDLIGTFNASYVWKISAGSQFRQTLRSEYGAKNTYLNPISELRLTIIRNFFVALGYEIRYNRATPEGTRHTDEITTVNIGYAFGKPTTTTPP